MRAHVPHPLRPSPPLIVNVAPTGMIPVKRTVPHVPVTTDEIVESVVACHARGATIAHLHARDEHERPAWQREAYAETISRLRERCPGLVICVSTSGRTFKELAQRADVLGLTDDARPDMASLTLGSLNFRTTASVNDPDTIRGLLDAMGEAGIKPELEIFDSGMAYLAADLLDREVLTAPLYANVLLGSLGTAPARAADLVHLTGLLPEGTVWAAAGIGAFQLPMNAMAVFMGGHVRTGLEDNPYLHHADRTDATNEELVERIGALAAIAERPVATPAETRALLGLAHTSQSVEGK